MPDEKPAPPRPPWTDDARGLVRVPAGSSTQLGVALQAGTVLARKYRLLRTAGFGGMAQLWVAKNESTGAEVCVKLLVPDTSDDESVERFRREAYAAARLSHRAIVRVFDLIELGPNGEDVMGGACSALAIVMELLHGETLAERLAKQGMLPLDEALDIALPFLSALAHAHRAGIVHRDVKPDNIFLSTDPDGLVIPKVLDFGVSKLDESRSITQDGVMLGTPSFMSPEQARGARSLDARSDVFSAGIVLYMMLTGKNPFESESFHSVVSAILKREVPRIPGLPDEVWAILHKALEKDPAARYADAGELALAMRGVAGRPSTADGGFPSSPTLRGGSEPAISALPAVAAPVPPALESAPPVDADTSAAFGAVPAKKAPTRLVAAGLGAALVVVVVALLKAVSAPAGETDGQPDSPTSRRGSPTGTASSAPAPPPPQASASAAGEAPAPTALRAVDGRPSRSGGDAGGAGGAVEQRAPAAGPAAARPSSPSAASPSASASARPAPSEIARDPGF